MTKPPTTVEAVYARDAEMSDGITASVYGDNTAEAIIAILPLRDEASARVKRLLETSGTRKKNAQAEAGERAIGAAKKGATFPEVSKAIGADKSIDIDAEVAAARYEVHVLDIALTGLRTVLAQEMYGRDGEARARKAWATIIDAEPKGTTKYADVLAMQARADALRPMLVAILLATFTDAGATRDELKLLRAGLDQATTVDTLPSLGALRATRKAQHEANGMTNKQAAFAGAISQGKASKVEPDNWLPSPERSELDAPLDEVVAEQSETTVEETEEAVA